MGYGAAIFLLAAAFLPLPVMEQGLLKYRTRAAPSAVIVLYAYFGARGFARAFRRRSLPGPAHAHLPIVRVPGDAPEPTPGPGDLVVDLKFLSRTPR